MDVTQKIYPAGSTAVNSFQGLGASQYSNQPCRSINKTFMDGPFSGQASASSVESRSTQPVAADAASLIE